MTCAPLFPAYAVEMDTRERHRPTSRAGKDNAADRRAGARRAQVLKAVRGDEEGVGVVALVEATGLHENTVRFHLNRLIEDGLVERRTVSTGAPGRPPMVFVATPAAAPGGGYQVIAEVLANGLSEVVEDPQEAARQIGREWGRRLGAGQGATGEVTQAVEELGSIMDRFGFDPEVEHEQGRSVIRIRTCPFVELTRDDPGREASTVPCAVHLGMMEGVLQEAGAGADVEVGLEPFVTPDCCLGRIVAN